MGDRSEPTAGGLSVRQLAFLFFVAVAVCGVFFALGYMYGNNRRSSEQTTSVQQVPPPSEIPPPVNPPPESSNTSANSSTPGPGSQSSAVIEQDLKGSSATPPTASSNAPSKSTATSASPANSPQSLPLQRAPRGIMVQVSASHTESAARSLIARLNALGYRALLITGQESGGKVYRVQVGPFPSRHEAAQTVDKLDRQGFKPFIKEE